MSTALLENSHTFGIYPCCWLFIGYLSSINPLGVCVKCVYSKQNADPVFYKAVYWAITIKRVKGKFCKKILCLSKLHKSPLLIWSLFVCCPTTSFVFPLWDQVCKFWLNLTSTLSGLRIRQVNAIDPNGLGSMGRCVFSLSQVEKFPDLLFLRYGYVRVWSSWNKYGLVVFLVGKGKLFIYAESTLVASWHRPFDNFPFWNKLCVRRVSSTAAILLHNLMYSILLQSTVYMLYDFTLLETSLFETKYSIMFRFHIILEFEEKTLCLLPGIPLLINSNFETTSPVKLIQSVKLIWQMYFRRIAKDQINWISKINALGCGTKIWPFYNLIKA